MWNKVFVIVNENYWCSVCFFVDFLVISSVVEFMFILVSGVLEKLDSFFEFKFCLWNIKD